MLKIFQSWITKRKKTIYDVGDKLYYLAPESQKVYSFIVDEVIISKYRGIQYSGEWNGILGGEHFTSDKLINHNQTHHCKESLIEQFAKNLKLVELK